MTEKEWLQFMTFFWKSIMPEAWRRLEKDV